MTEDTKRQFNTGAVRKFRPRFVALVMCLGMVPGLSAESENSGFRPQTIEQFMEVGGRVRVIAHRGFSGKAPENTVSAILEAIWVGADMVEIDVTLTADGRVVLLHDEKVQRTTDGRGRISDLTLAEVQRLDAGSWFSSDFEGERIPTLDAVLEAARGRILITIEVKPSTVEDGIVEKVVEEINRHTMKDFVMVSSFSSEALALVHAVDPGVHTASLYKWRLFRRVDPGRIVDEVRSLLFNINRRYLSRKIRDRCRDRGIPIGVYTVNSRRQMEQQIERGVHAIFTDHPDILIEVIAERATESESESLKP